MWAAICLDMMDMTIDTYFCNWLNSCCPSMPHTTVEISLESVIHGGQFDLLQR